MVWRACTNCLPTMVQLRTKHVDVAIECPMCNESEESIVHCLVDCPVAQRCWNRVGIGTGVATVAGFSSWFEACFQQSNEDSRDMLAATCWALWGARNDKVWNQQNTDTMEVVSSAKSYLEQWKVAQVSGFETTLSGLTKDDGAEQWRLPPSNSVKINVDGAIFADTNEFGLGVVVRDDKGFLVEGKTRLFHGKVAAEVAEALSFREALSWIKQNPNWPHVIVETDCLLVVQSLRSSFRMISVFGNLINDCKLMLNDLSFISFFFVKRSANVVAHSFARASCSYPDRTFSLGDVPTELLSCLVTEFDA
ncbi:hypothetical protein CsatA_009255 [Cannabis sativa]